MNPRRLNPDSIQRRLREIRRLLDWLEQHRDVTKRALEDDLTTRLSVEHALEQLVELASNINIHVVAATGHVPPVDYEEAFREAATAGLIAEDLAAGLARSGGMRNVIVHEYVRVDRAKIATSVPEALDRYREYLRQVAERLPDLEQQLAEAGNEDEDPGDG